MDQANNNQSDLLITVLHNLAGQRQRLIELEACYKEFFAEFTKSHRALITDIELQKQVLEQTEKEVRDVVKTRYEKEGNKDVCKGVKIKCFKRFEYDVSEAYQYALDSEHRDSLVFIDTKKFEKYYSKILEAGIELPFVSTSIEPIPYIAKDLAKALQT